MAVRKCDDLYFPLRGWKISEYRNKCKKSKFYSERNEDKIEFRDCLLSFGAECFVFQFAVKTAKCEDVQSFNFACFFVWVWNLVYRIEVGTWAEGV
jgi:hypothetical protein